jgi:hypothetical protein
VDAGSHSDKIKDPAARRAVKMAVANPFGHFNEQSMSYREYLARGKMRVSDHIIPYELGGCT